MDRSHQKGYIFNPANRNKSVELAEEGLAEAGGWERNFFPEGAGRNVLPASSMFCPEAVAFVVRSRR
jgi:hypothetical protein